MLQVLKYLANAIVILYFSLLTLSSYRYFETNGSARAFGLVLMNAFFVALFVMRREPKAVSPIPLAWCLAFAGTLVPLMMRPGGAASPMLSATGEVLQAAGLLLIGVALLSLRRSFGIVAANRGVMTGGLYRFVRHPLYTGELVFVLGFTFACPSGWNIALWVMELGLQAARARIEEGFLSFDPVYEQYRRKVRHRFIPGVL